MEYIRILPEKNDPAAMRQFVKILIEIAQRLQNQKPTSSDESQERT